MAALYGVVYGLFLRLFADSFPELLYKYRGCIAHCESGGGDDFCGYAEIVAEKRVDEPHVRASFAK